MKIEKSIMNKDPIQLTFIVVLGLELQVPLVIYEMNRYIESCQLPTMYE